MGVFYFWGKSLRRAFSFGWTVFGVVTTALPYVLYWVHNQWPQIESRHWIKWVIDNQIQSHFCSFVGAFIIYLFYAPYVLWKERDEDAKRLEKRLTPQPKVECDPSIEGCVKPSSNGAVFRVKITNHGVSPVKGCQGRLVSIKHNGKVLWGGDPAILTFAPGEEQDSASKTLVHDTPEYLDVVFLNHEVEGPPYGERETLMLRPGTKGQRWSYSPRFKDMFSAYGDYILTIAFVSDSAAMMKLQDDFLLNWTGDVSSSTLTMMKK